MALQVENLIPQKKLADMLGVSIQTLWRWSRYGINGKKLIGIKLGSRVYYDQNSVERFSVATGKVSR